MHMTEEAYKKIFSHRVRTAHARQPECKKQLDQCIRALQLFEVEHPYRLSAQAYYALMNFDFFATAAAGPTCRVAHKHLYRLCSFDKLFASKHFDDGYYTRAFEDMVVSTRNTSGKALFDMFMKQQEVGTRAGKLRWLPLGQYMLSKLPLRRGFNWWTCETMETNDPATLFSIARKCGVPDNWVSNESIVLRLAVTEQNRKRIRIPTEIDALDSPIFRQRHLHLNPSTGKTIPLDQKELMLEHFHREYVVKAPQASDIDFFVVPTPPQKNSPVNLPNLEDALLDFYQQL